MFIPSRLRRPMPGLLPVLLLTAGCALSVGCISKEDPMFWSPEIKDRIHKVTVAELMADFRVEAERIRTASPPVQRQDDWPVRQGMQALLRGLNESVPAEMFEIDERLNQVGMTGSWYELTDPTQPPENRHQEWILWIHEPFGQYSGSGMYFFRFPHDTKLSMGLPAGFENNALTESAVELFLRSPQIVTLAINTPSLPPPKKPGTGNSPGKKMNKYQVYIETWLTTGNRVFWLDLCTYPRVPASENLYLGAITVATNGKNKPLTGRAVDIRKKLLDAGMTVETLGDNFDVPGMTLPPYSIAMGSFTKQAQSEYLLLAFPTTALDKPQKWLEQMQTALPVTKFGTAPRKKSPLGN